MATKSAFYEQDPLDSHKNEGINDEMKEGIKNQSSSNDKWNDLPGSESEKNPFDRFSGKSKRGFIQVNEKIKNFGENLKETGQDFSDQIQRKVTSNPWLFIGGAAIAAMGLGFIVGRKGFRK